MIGKFEDDSRRHVPPKVHRLDTGIKFSPLVTELLSDTIISDGFCTEESKKKNNEQTNIDIYLLVVLGVLVVCIVVGYTCAMLYWMQRKRWLELPEWMRFASCVRIYPQNSIAEEPFEYVAHSAKSRTGGQKENAERVEGARECEYHIRVIQDMQGGEHAPLENEAPESAAMELAGQEKAHLEDTSQEKAIQENATQKNTPQEKSSQEQRPKENNAQGRQLHGNEAKKKATQKVLSKQMLPKKT